MARVYEIDQKRVFTLDEAKELLPVIRRITQAAESRVRNLSRRFSYLTDEAQKKQVEDEIRQCVAEWQSKIVRLGLETKGLWLVDFDNGEGYWCWQFPEPELKFTHGYHEGFRQRRELPEIIPSTPPVQPIHPE